jgi:hypothetical protein
MTGYGDGFYQAVAEEYEENSAPGFAKRMAAQEDVPVTTVHRWIKEARRRGFLPPVKWGWSSDARLEAVASRLGVSADALASALLAEGGRLDMRPR